MKLALLADQIVAAAPEGMLTSQMIYASLNFFGPQNGHLAIPEWHSREHRSLDMQRFEFLTGEEEIRGDVLVFRYCRWDDEVRLTEYATIADAAEAVRGAAGIFNGWIDVVFVFEHFRLRPYRATYRNKAGVQVVLDRKRWNPVKDRPPIEERQIEWLDEVG